MTLMGAEVDGPSQNRRGPNRITDSSRKIRRAEARTLAWDMTMGNPKWRWRLRMGLQEGTIHPSIERAVLEIADVFPKGKTDLADEVGRGLLNFILRRPLNEDPLAEPKLVGASSTLLELPAGQPEPEPRASIIPPARPKKRVGTGPPLKPGETELP